MIKNLINKSLIQTVQTIRTAMVRIEKGRTNVTWKFGTQFLYRLVMKHIKRKH